MTYSDFEARWKPSGGAERANYGLFLQDLCDLIGVPRPDPTTDNPAEDAYVLERAVTFGEGTAKPTTAESTSTNAAVLCSKPNKDALALPTNLLKISRKPKGINWALRPINSARVTGSAEPPNGSK